MHGLFSRVLDQRDLSKAGDLFSVEDSEIVDDLSLVLHKIEEISSSRGYTDSDNDQSVVEICITRVTSAIRETGTIERHAAALVSLLDTCLQHSLQPSPRDEDTPHAKIASDIMSCVFLNYAKRPIMELAIPVAVKFLRQGNNELSRNVCSYLSLAAIENADTLAKHILPIIDSITSGNHSLVRVLPQIYAEDRDAVNLHISELIGLLDKCGLAEKNGLIQLVAQISKYKPELLEGHLGILCDLLQSNVTALSVLQIFVDMVSRNARPFTDHVTAIKECVNSQPANLECVSKIVGAIGRQSETQAVPAMEYLVSQLTHADSNTQVVLLKEIKSIGELYHAALDAHMNTISGQATGAPSSSTRLLIQQIQHLGNTRNKCNEKDLKSCWSHTEDRVTVIAVGGHHGNTTEYTTVNGDKPLTAIQRSQDKSLLERPYSAITTSSTHSERTGASGHSVATFSSNTYPIKDTVQHFCEKHLVKIKNFIDHFSARLPLPVKCTVEERKGKKYSKVHFVCHEKSDQCLYCNNFFPMKTKHPKLWVHIMFLNIQSRSPSALSSMEPIVASLKATWETLRLDGSNSFVRLVTSSFPSAKDQECLRQELVNWRYFDVFEFNGTKKSWSCFLCNHPEKASGLLKDGPVIEGQLKEKKGRWKFFKRWKTRYFTLSGAHMTYACSKSDSRRETLPVCKIQSVKAVKKGTRDIPKAFEIFTNDETYVLKAKDGKNAEQWVQCLHIAWARSTMGRPPTAACREAPREAYRTPTAACREAPREACKTPTAACREAPREACRKEENTADATTQSSLEEEITKM